LKTPNQIRDATELYNSFKAKLFEKYKTGAQDEEINSDDSSILFLGKNSIAVSLSHHYSDGDHTYDDGECLQ